MDDDLNPAFAQPNIDNESRKRSLKFPKTKVSFTKSLSIFFGILIISALFVLLYKLFA